MTDAPRPPSRPVDLTSGDPLGALHHWIADGRIDEAARARARQHWLERQAAEDATMLGVLIDLAERGRPVTATTVAGRRVTCPVRAVGADVGETVAQVHRDPRQEAFQVQNFHLAGANLAGDLQLVGSGL